MPRYIKFNGQTLYKPGALSRVTASPNRRTNLGLESRRAAAECPDPCATAGRAATERFGRGPAPMAAQQRPRAVEDERSFAGRTGLRCAAVPAEKRRGDAATVDDQQRLGPTRPVEPLESREQRTADHAAPLLGELLSQVDHLDLRRRRSRGEGDAHPTLGIRASERLDRRCRAQEQCRRAEIGRAHV